MSNMIKCDGCGKLMYADSRSEKGAYYEFWIDQYARYHLCHECYTKFMNTILHMYWDEDMCDFIKGV